MKRLKLLKSQIENYSPLKALGFNIISITIVLIYIREVLIWRAEYYKDDKLFIILFLAIIILLALWGIKLSIEFIILFKEKIKMNILLIFVNLLILALHIRFVSWEYMDICSDYYMIMFMLRIIE